MSKTKEIPTKTKRVSRRDALKVLTAVAGATALANTPARWSKPEMKVGVLPVHAQTSVITPVYTVIAGPDQEAPLCGNGDPLTITSTATILPKAPNVLLRFNVTSVDVTTSPSTGTKATDSNGDVSVSIDTDGGHGNGSHEVTVVWSFENPANGTGSDDQRFIPAC